jgi:hypothetical protein
VFGVPARMEDLSTGKVMTVEEAKFYPALNPEPISLEPGELPACYGKSRLVLLPVDPYLMYVYWELADPPPAAGARAVLRVYEAGRPFDVEVDLAAGKWYVHLWSSDKVYQADLGLRGVDGAFVILAQSNTVNTPPANPVPPTPVTQTSVCDPPPFASPPKVEVPAHLQQRLPEIFAVRGELPYPDEPSSVTAFRLSVPEPRSTDFGLSRPEPRNTDFSLSKPDEIPDGIPGETPHETPHETKDKPPFKLDALVELDLTQYAEERFTLGISSQGGPLGE